MSLDVSTELYVKRTMDNRARLGIPPSHLQTPQQHRHYRDAGPFPAGPELHDVGDVSFAGPHGEVRCRLYRPTVGALPLLLYFHGGGWVCGTLDSVDGTMRHLAKASGHAILSVDYRRAPEHKFPVALEEGLAALKWIGSEGTAFGFDTSVISVGGASAGGNLAAAVALRNAHEEGPPLAHQLLVYPCLSPECASLSYEMYAEDFVMTTATMRWYWAQYVADLSSVSEYAAPLSASRFAGLPRCHVIVAENDPLKDDGRRYASKLIEAGVSVSYTEFEGVIHGFFNQFDSNPKGLQAIQLAADELKRSRNIHREQARSK